MRRLAATPQVPSRSPQRHVLRLPRRAVCVVGLGNRAASLFEQARWMPPIQRSPVLQTRSVVSPRRRASMTVVGMTIRFPSRTLRTSPDRTSSYKVERPIPTIAAATGTLRVRRSVSAAALADVEDLVGTVTPVAGRVVGRFGSGGRGWGGVRRCRRSWGRRSSG